jgi:SAM-dependent methyltransferase
LADRLTGSTVPSATLYDNAYGSASDPAQAAVRHAIYGEDFGQTGWMTGAEHDWIIELLNVSAADTVLEVACGVGGSAKRIRRKTGARVTGVDVNVHAISAAQRQPQDRVDFVHADGDEPLPFASAQFDAIFCNDAVNHLRDRKAALGEWARLLKSKGRLFFTDPVVVTGPVSSVQLAVRSSIGHFLFLPPGMNEDFLAGVGFVVKAVHDMTDSLVRISQRWREARDAGRTALVHTETAEQFAATQQFLACVNELGRERRLSRIGYLAVKR